MDLSTIKTTQVDTSKSKGCWTEKECWVEHGLLFDKKDGKCLGLIPTTERYPVTKICGWLEKLRKEFKLSDKEYRELEIKDEKVIEYIKNEAYDPHREIMTEDKKKIKEFIQEIEGGVDKKTLKEMKLRKIQERIDNAEHDLEEIYGYYDESMQADKPKWMRDAVLSLNRPEEVEKLIKRLKMQRYLIQHDQTSKNWVGPEMIEQARNVPFDQLIKIPKNCKIKCFKHKEKVASMHWKQKNNTLHCFGCGYHADPIDYIQDKNKLSFPEAVKLLCQI